MKVIVMTGATSGIGAETMKHLTKQPDTLQQTFTETNK
jgi:NADP-dependent 3-hydroxy acid dehydrogenase YdfG